MAKFTLLFAGDSLIADFDWQSRMPGFNIHNYGLPGETAQGLLNRVDFIHQEVKNPEAILLMIGTNNLLIEDYSFPEVLRKIIIKLTNCYPGTEIIVNSVLPISVPWVADSSLIRINKIFEQITLQTGSCFLDVYSKFTQTGTNLFQADGIHLTEQAYDIWAKSILEFIAFLVED